MSASKLMLCAEAYLQAGNRDALGDRRAVSTAYYAVFHNLAQLCADELLGKSRRRSDEYERIYRAPDHGQMRAAFSTHPLRGNVTLQAIGLQILQLQAERHRADYLPLRRIYSPLQCAEIVRQARATIAEIAGLSPDDRRILSICLLFKNRQTQMKLTLPWLHDHLETSATLGAITDTLTRIGLEVEHIDNTADRLAGYGVVFCGRASLKFGAGRAAQCQRC